MTRTSPALSFLPTIAAALLLIGCLGAWVSIDASPISESVAGTETDDGKLLIGFSIVLIAGTLLASKRWMWVILSVIAFLALVIAVVDVADVGSESQEFFGESIGYSAGWGLWLCVLAAAVCLGASVWRAAKSPQRTVGAKPAAA